MATTSSDAIAVATTTPRPMQSPRPGPRPMPSPEATNHVRCHRRGHDHVRCHRREPRTTSDAITEATTRSEEHTSELQSPCNLVCRLLLEKKKTEQHAAS